MELLDLIQISDSAQQVMELLRAYVDTLRAAAPLPEWWLHLPLDNPDHARQRMAELLAMVNAASRQLDDGRCAAAKQALQVFAVGVWKLKSRAAKRWPILPPRAAPADMPGASPPAGPVLQGKRG
jgi:hypothetical protein